MRKGKIAALSFLGGALVIAGIVAVAGYSQIMNLAAFTYFYSGFDIFARPNYAIPRLPAAENFELVGHVGGAPGAIAVAGDYAFVGLGTEFVVVDVTDPSRPRVVAGLTLLSCIKDIRVSGKTAYVADGRGGLRLVDISDPEHPKEQSTFGHRSAVQSVAVRGTFAYAAAGIEGVQVLDCSNPERPRLTGFRDSVPGRYGPDSTAIVAVDHSLCVVDGSSGLRLLDTQDAARPRLLNSVEREGGSDCVLAGEGHTIVVAGHAGSEGLWLYERDNDKLRLRAPVKVPEHWWTNGAVVQDRHAYLATSNGLLIVDLSDPAKPVTVAAWDSQPLANVAVENGRGFLTSVSGDFLIVDLANKSKPAVLGVLHQPGAVLTSCMSRDVVLTGSSGSVEGFRFSTDGIIQKTPLFSVPLDHARYISCSQGIAAVLNEVSNDPSGCREWLEVWDFKERGQMRNLLRVAAPGSNLRPVFTKNGVATGGYKGLYTVAFPLSNRSPQLNFLAFKRGIRALASRDNILFVATHNEGGPDAVEVYDPTNPAQLRLLRSITLGDSIDGLCCKGNYLYATSGRFLGKNSLMIFDVSSPSKITHVSSLELFGGTSVEVDNGIAYVEEVSRVSAIDVSDPLHPKVIGKIDTIAVPMSIVDLSVQKDLCCLAAEQAGLYVYRLGTTRRRF